jgi:hypothetical protein
MLLLILQKSAKSLQGVLNELLGKLHLPAVSKRAFSQARQHLGHTAFIELNQRGLVDVYCRWRLSALLGLAGSGD